jgi:hypothetical protein
MEHEITTTMKLLCEAATVRPTIARCVEQIASYHARHDYSSYPGLSFETWECILGDMGMVSIRRTQKHFQLWDIEETFKAAIGVRLYDLTRAEIHALGRAIQHGSHRSFARLPEPKAITKPANRLCNHPS